MSDEQKQESKPKRAPTTAGNRSVRGAWVTYNPAAPPEIGVYADEGAASGALFQAAGTDPITDRYVFVPWGMTVKQAVTASKTRQP